MSAWWKPVVNDRTRFIEIGSSLPIVESEEALLWNSHSFESRMIDVWATADDLLSCHEVCGGSDSQKLESYAERMDALVTFACADLSRGPGFRDTIREAQWEVFNYVFGDNDFQHNGKSSMSWFDQFMYDINYALV